MVRRSPWRHDAQRSGYATFGCTRCGHREELVVAHYSEEQELFLHAQRPTYTGRARCPRCGEPMEPRGLGEERPGVLRFACARCGGARDTLLSAGSGHRGAGSAGRVMVVDRDRERAGSVAGMLREEAEDVALARDEAEAVEMLGREPCRVLVVADDGALNPELLLARARGLSRPPHLALLLTSHPEIAEEEPPPGAVRLPLPPRPALLAWFVAYGSEDERVPDEGGSVRVG